MTGCTHPTLRHGRWCAVCNADLRPAKRGRQAKVPVKPSRDRIEQSNRTHAAMAELWRSSALGRDDT